jgi:cysteinyl-tRNA synthetase
MDLKLWNTRTRSLEVFKPLSGNEVRLYCCGPTVYHFAHIGNLRTYIFEDLLRRTLGFFGHGVSHVMNITDVGHLTDDGDEGEDKMTKAARERGMSVWDIAEHYTSAFFDDCRRLNIVRPEIVCKATDHIADMVALIRRLEERGMTYVADGNVYYDVSRFPQYQEFARLDKEELRAGARIEVDAAKRNPQDFVLWFTNSKFKDQAMLWDSPWGRGYPGWHIECSAMSHRYLGEQFDIHCGGVDHIKVHHTNEIAQTEGATGKRPWVRFWMHGEFLVLNNAKMSKSSGDFLTLSRLAEIGYGPLDYRYFCLGAHYRIQLNFSDESIGAAKSARANLVDRIKTLALQAESAAAGSGRGQTAAALLAARQRQAGFEATGKFLLANPPVRDLADGVAVAGEPASLPLSPAARGQLEVFQSHLADDLNLPRALACVFDTLKSILGAGERLRLIHIMDQVLGLDLLASAEERLLQDEQASSSGDFSPAEAAEIEGLIAERKAARAAKDFARGDQIRDQLKARGIALVDTPQGTTFKRV